MGLCSAVAYRTKPEMEHSVMEEAPGGRTMELEGGREGGMVRGSKRGE